MIKHYNKISYPFKIKDRTIYIDITDISTNVRIQQELANSLAVYNYHTVQDGQTPEMIAFHDYSNVNYYYLVMLANEMYDWRECYPLTQLELDNYVNEKYIDPNGIHHLENAKGLRSDTLEGAFTIPITNYEYEYGLNEAKRLIKTIKSQYAQTVVDTLKQKILNG